MTAYAHQLLTATHCLLYVYPQFAGIAAAFVVAGLIGIRRRPL